MPFIHIYTHPHHTCIVQEPLGDLRKKHNYNTAYFSSTVNVGS